MAEENGNGHAAAAMPQQQGQQTLPRMQVVAQFIRDLSFENLAAQNRLTGEAQPEISVQVGLDAKKREQADHYDVILKLNISAKGKESGAQIFLMELEYGGVFRVENLAEAQLHPFLLIECPRMLFPFVRRIVSDVTHDSGYPSLNLDNIDFLQLYRQQILQQQQQRASDGGGSPAA